MGRWLYGSNRGHDSILVAAIGENGLPTPVDYTPTGGRTPRNFALSPDGRFLLAANQDSDNVVVFAIDAASGRLAPTGHVAALPAPVCIRFAPPA
jgi:6-phosphogluconolactonase